MPAGIKRPAYMFSGYGELMLNGYCTLPRPMGNGPGILECLRGKKPVTLHIRKTVV